MGRERFDYSIRAVRGGRVYVFEGRDPRRTNVVAVGDGPGEAILTEAGVRALHVALGRRLKELARKRG